MSEAQVVQVQKLERLREAWLPAVEFLFGKAAPGAVFEGFEVSSELAKPTALFVNEDEPYRYKLCMPARSFTNDVMLLADVVQEMVRGLYPVGFQQHSSTALSEGCAVYGAVTAITQAFGEATLDAYLNALKDNAFAYYDAFSYVAVLLTEDPEGVKKLREVQPFLYQVKREDFAKVGIQLDRKIEDILTYTFRV